MSGHKNQNLDCLTYLPPMKYGMIDILPSTPSPSTSSPSISSPPTSSSSTSSPSTIHQEVNHYHRPEYEASYDEYSYYDMTDFVEESLARCRSSKHIVLQQLKSDEGNEFIFGLDDMAVHSRLSKDSEVVGDCDDIKDLIDNSLAYCRNSKQHLVPDAEHRHSYNTFIFLGSEDLGEQDDYPELKDYEENVGEPTNSSEDSEDDEPSYKYHHCSIKPCIMGCQAPDSRMDWRCADERPAKKQRCQ